MYFVTKLLLAYVALKNAWLYPYLLKGTCVFCTARNHFLRPMACLVDSDFSELNVITAVTRKTWQTAAYLNR